MTDTELAREERARLAAAEEARIARIVAVARADPDLSSAALQERFGLPEHTIRRILRAHGLKAARDDFGAISDSNERVRKSRAAARVRYHRNKGGTHG